MAESSFAWVSVVVKRGPVTVFPRKIVKTGWESNFGELLTAADPTLANSIKKVCISSNDSFLDPVHEVDVTAPLIYHCVAPSTASLFVSTWMM